MDNNPHGKRILESQFGVVVEVQTGKETVTHSGVSDRKRTDGSGMMKSGRQENWMMMLPKNQS